MSLASIIPPARATRRHLKILGFSDWGGGKSSFACTLPGPRAVFDLEHGCDNYVTLHTDGCPAIEGADCNGCGGDYHLTSLDPEKILAGVKAVALDGGRTIRSVIIDPVTVFQAQMIDAFGKDEMQFQDWKAVKNPLKRMLYELMNMPVHFMLTARLKDLEVVKKLGKTEIKTVDKPDMWKDFGYAPDVILRFRMEEKLPRQFTWSATVLKNRLKGLRAGQVLESGVNGENPLTFDSVFGPVLAAMPEGAPMTEYDDPVAAAATAREHGAPTVAQFTRDQEAADIESAMREARDRGDMPALKAAFGGLAKIKDQISATRYASLVMFKDKCKEVIDTATKGAAPATR